MTVTRTPDEAVEALMASCLPCQLAAQTAEVDLSTEPEDSLPWEGILTYEGQMTGDGRYIENGALRWDTLPIPLRWVESDTGAHQGAVVVGRITDIERRDDGAIYGRGDFDLGSESGREAARQVQKGLTPGVSIDMDDVSFEVRVAAETGIDGDPDDIDESGRVKAMAMNADDEVMITNSGRVRAATLIAIPAFEGARLSAGLTAGFNPDQLRVPQGNGEFSGRWVDMPGKVFGDFGFDVNPGAVRDFFLAAGNHRPATERKAQELGHSLDEIQKAAVDNRSAEEAARNALDSMDLADHASVKNAVDLAKESIDNTMAFLTFTGSNDAKTTKRADEAKGLLDDFASLDLYSDPDFDPANPDVADIRGNDVPLPGVGNRLKRAVGIGGIDNGPTDVTPKGSTKGKKPIDSVTQDRLDKNIAQENKAISKGGSPDAPPSKPVDSATQDRLTRNTEREIALSFGKYLDTVREAAVDKDGGIIPPDQQDPEKKQAKLDAKRSVEEIAAENGYDVDFLKETATNKETGRVINIRTGAQVKEEPGKTNAPDAAQPSTDVPNELNDVLPGADDSSSDGPPSDAEINSIIDDATANVPEASEQEMISALVDAGYDEGDLLDMEPEDLASLFKLVAIMGDAEAGVQASAYRDVSPAERKMLTKKGNALPDGSFPIANANDLKNAIQAVGRAKDVEMAKRHIKKRAKELKQEKLIPTGWALRIPERVQSFNWVQQVGGLPQYIKRIATHLKAKGMLESHAIATAVNVVKKMCATGDINFPGKQDVNAGSHAEACAAVAEWEAKKSAARVIGGLTAGMFDVSAKVKDQARVPKGNGELSGRWIDMPGSTLDNLFDRLDPSLVDGNEYLTIVNQRRLDLPDKPFKDTEEVKYLADELRSAESSIEGDGATDLDVQTSRENISIAADSLTDFGSVDWYSDPNYDPENPPADDVAPAEDGLFPAMSPANEDRLAELKRQRREGAAADPAAQGQSVEEAKKAFNELARAGDEWAADETPLTQEQQDQVQQVQDDLLQAVEGDAKTELGKIFRRWGIPKTRKQFAGFVTDLHLWFTDLLDKFGLTDADAGATQANPGSSTLLNPHQTVMDIAHAAHTLALVVQAIVSSGALTAGAFPLQPPPEWFGDPGFTGPTPLRVDEDGRVYGHLAVWGTCHTAYPGQCVTPPTSRSSYSYFRTGSVMLSNGSEVPTGVITMDTLHAGKALSGPSTLAHYEHTGRAVADVSAGEDAYGIWVAGALRSTVTDEQARALRGSPLSGDWRNIGGTLELVAALAVNVPGFPIPRPSGLVAGGKMQALVASGILSPERMVVEEEPEEDDVTEVVTAPSLTADLPYLRRLAERERKIIEKEAAAMALKVKVIDLANRVGV